MESPLNETPAHHYRTCSNVEHKITERPKIQRRLSSYNRNEHKRKMYNDSNTFITTADNSTTTTITKDTKNTKDTGATTNFSYFGSFSPIKNNLDNIFNGNKEE
ncbi:hypothetical protein RCL_jg26923.t1 [Rhizophagus clarus]|uniref:Uncharacterized protein n=1 Tax=Rhizophagus clarus TaxID=94130 RepID=A0A8H3LIP4_9GLOM|nr:hypothetical protein RCL_jg26923.t1 [Rhizophagus clarus]